MTQSSSITPKAMLRIIASFAVLILVGSTLVYFGSRNDASEVAKSLKVGVLTADEVNVAFESVGGRVTVRDIEESQQVKKGDVLMVLDDTDLRIAIDLAQAGIAAQKAMIEEQTQARKIAVLETDLAQKAAWRSIEETQAALVAAQAAQRVAQRDFERAQRLSRSGAVSQSAFDGAQAAVTQADAQVTQAQRRLASATIGATAEQLRLLVSRGSAQGMRLDSIGNAREAIVNRDNAIAVLRSQLAQSQSALEQLQVNRSRLTLRAPQDGRVLKVLYETGELVAPGATGVLLETDRRYFDIYVNETLVSAYRPGTRVTAQAHALNASFGGVVRFADAAPSFADLRMTRERGQADLTSYQVRIYVD